MEVASASNDIQDERLDTEDNVISSSGNDELNKSSTNFNLNNLTGVLNSQNKRQISVQSSQNVQFKETEINSNVHHHHYKSDTDFNECISDLKDTFQNLYTVGPAWNDLYPLLRRDDIDKSIKIEALNGTTGLEEIPLNHFLNPDQNYQKPLKRVLLFGEEEAGKTFLTRKIAYDWAVGKKHNLAKNFDLLLVSELKTLSDGDDLESILLKSCFELSIKGPKDQAGKIEALKSSKILLILDGFEAAKEQLKEKVLTLLETLPNSQSVFQKATIILTSRPVVDSLQETLPKLFQKLYQISHEKLPEIEEAPLPKGMVQLSLMDLLIPRPPSTKEDVHNFLKS